MVADAVDDSTGQAVLTPPVTGRPWATYELTVCVRGASPADCLGTAATAGSTPVVTCTAAADKDASTTCPLPGLKPETVYDITAVAIQSGGTTSDVSNLDSLTTPKLPAPSLAASATGPESADIVVTPPAIGEPWQSYSLLVCTATSCFTKACSPVATPPATTTCPLAAADGLTEKTSYTVTVVAVKADGTTTLRSAPDAFTTPSSTCAPCLLGWAAQRWGLALRLCAGCAPARPRARACTA